MKFNYDPDFSPLPLIIVILIIWLISISSGSPKYIDVNDRTKTREEIVDNILRKGCSNKNECDVFLKKYREDKIKRSWAE